MTTVTFHWYHQRRRRRRNNNNKNNNNIMLSLFLLSFISPSTLSFIIPHNNNKRHPHLPLILRHSSSLSATTTTTTDPPPPIPPTIPRGRVNEIDFCMAPSDVSLSRSFYSPPSPPTTATTTSSADIEMDSSSPSSSGGADATSTTPTTRLSLTRALNSASNRTLRRILLSRSWPSAEALNESLRRVLRAGRKSEEENSEDDDDDDVVEEESSLASSSADDDDEEGAKCPVPRPILNVIMRRQRRRRQRQKEEKEKEIVPQPRSSRGQRSETEYVADQIASFGAIYGGVPGYEPAEAYLECLLSLATSGVESERVEEVLETGIYDVPYRRLLSVLESVGAVFEKVPGTSPPMTRIARKLTDQDICLSMIDSITIRKERMKQQQHDKTKSNANDTTATTTDSSSSSDTTNDQQLSPENDLGAVLLSSSEPSITRQLNVLSNIVQRALLFGGDEELLVLSETLAADKPTFIKRWYPTTSSDDVRPGVDYLSSLILLLQTAQSQGVITSLIPPLPLSSSYANAYDRLLTNLVERGSGYIKPLPTATSSSPLTTAPIVTPSSSSITELSRFANWEIALRQTSPDISLHPQDMIGNWTVVDEIAGRVVGTSATVRLLPDGIVDIPSSQEGLVGLRWRLDPGPTHLDTCTFRVLREDDGTVLQYRGFIDRGARWESRFSKRGIKVRGSVMFQQMREGVGWGGGEVGGGGTQQQTRFVMTKVG